jgi:hypothetical protein
MAIIISSNGDKAVKVEKSSIDKEDYLQKYIYENPESIPLYDIKEDIRLLILAREFPTNSGPIDAIGIDQEGTIYIIETKLFKNPDKRTVVAQALDYGAALWKHSNDFNEFVSILNNHTQKNFKLNVNDKLKEFFEMSDEELESLLDKVKNNLSDGILKFVVLMDSLDDRLKDLILYVNQNSQFDIYAVELEYYKHDTYEIIIPKLYGAEVKKDIGVSSSSSRRKWTEESLLKEAKDKLSVVEFSAYQKMYDFSKKYADKINFGTGAQGSFSPIFEKLSSKSLYSVYVSSGYSFGLNFEWVAKNGREDTARLFKEKMSGLGFDIPENYIGLRPSLQLEGWVPKVDSIIASLEEMLGIK